MAAGKEAGRVTIKVIADTDGFREAVERAARSLGGRNDRARVPLDVDDSRAGEAIERFKDQAGRERVKIRLDVDKSRGLDVLDDVAGSLLKSMHSVGSFTGDIVKSFSSLGDRASDVQKLSGNLGDLGSQAGKAGGAFGQLISQIGGSAFGLVSAPVKIAALGAAVSALGGALVGVVGAAAGVATALVGIGVGAVGGITAVALGFDGIKTAAKAMTPAVDEAKTAISGVFESSMAGGFDSLSSTLGKLTPSLQVSAESLGRVFSSISENLGSTGNLERLTTIISNTSALFAKITPGMNRFVDGLLTLGNGGVQAIMPLLDGFNQMGDSFAKSMQSLVDSGNLTKIVQSGFDVLGSLGSAFSNTMGAIFAETPNLAPVLVDMFAALDDTLVALVPNLSAMAQGFLPVITAIGQQLAPALTELQPLIKDTASVMGDALVEAITILGPHIPQLVQGFLWIMQSIAPMIPAFAQLVVSILPLIGVINNLITIGGVMAQVFLNMKDAVGSGIAPSLQDIVSVAMLAVGAFTGLGGAVQGAIAVATLAFQGLGVAASGGVGAAVSAVASLPGQAVAALGGIGGMLISSGRALVQGFIKGILSMVAAVAAAARQVVAAARAYFPFSPAKKGPFSGSGYTTHSGRALVQDFAAAMISERGAVAAAAKSVASVAQSQLSGIEVTPRGLTSPGLESFWAGKAEEKAKLENAKRIERAIENYDEQMRKHQANPKKYKKPEKLTMPDLVEPDYDDIDRSFDKFVLGALKESFNDSLVAAFESVDVGGAIESAIASARLQGVNLPIFDDVLAGIADPRFKARASEALRKSGIGEIPLTVGEASLSQLQTDLGMRDGVIARGIRAARRYDPWKQSDFYQEAKMNAQAAPVTYQVLNVDDALRIEELKRRNVVLREQF